MREKRLAIKGEAVQQVDLDKLEDSQMLHQTQRLRGCGLKVLAGVVPIRIMLVTLQSIKAVRQRGIFHHPLLCCMDFCCDFDCLFFLVG